MSTVATDLTTAFYRHGQVADCPIYDMHGHMGPVAGLHLPHPDPDAMVAACKRNHVAKLVFCHHDSLFSPEVGNTPNIAAVRKHPDIFKAYCGINPNYPDAIAADIASYDQHRDVYVGFKLLADYHQIAIDDDVFVPVWEFAHANKLLVLLHTWGSSSYDGPDNVAAVAKRWPDATILMGHSCHGQWTRACDLVKTYPNVYLELTAVLDERGILETFVESTGADRILYGTDYPWFNQHYYIGAVLDADITDADRRAIFYANAQRLLKPFTH